MTWHDEFLNSVPVKPYHVEDAGIIYCADCRDILPHLPKVDLVIADPPYGMSLDASFKNSTPNKRKGIGASRGYENVIGDREPFCFKSYYSLIKSVEQFWFGPDYYNQELPLMGSWLVWDKRQGLETLQYSSSEFELIWSKKAHLKRVLRHRWFGLCGTETQDVRKRVHPCQKPLELIKELALMGKGDIILDPFLGSGTTAVAAKELGRKFIGIEISEEYCKIAVKRLRQGVLNFA